jgi:hypothetical protein
LKQPDKQEVSNQYRNWNPVFNLLGARGAQTETC